MSQYDERKLSTVNACPSCKHCYAGELNSTGDLWYFCLLGVSEEDREYLEEEIWDRGGCIDYDSSESYSPKLLDIMKLGEKDMFTYSSRGVDDYNVCQFFEKED